MPNPYARIFAVPGTKGFTVAGIIGRMPVAMTNVGIITMLAATHGSYALAGAVAATFTLSMALLTPQVSRLADRHGQPGIEPERWMKESTLPHPADIAACASRCLRAKMRWSRWPWRREGLSSPQSKPPGRT